MRKVIFIYVIFSLSSVLCSAQSVKVSDPRPELRGNTIYIYYDIIGSDSSEEFLVSLLVLEKNGQEIPARSLSGDIGESVYGGKDKVIKWDLSSDQVEMEAQIFFKVLVKRILPPEPVVVLPPPIEEKTEEEVLSQVAGNGEEELQEVGDTEEPARERVNEKIKEFSRVGIVAQSLVVPGLGLSRITGKPHWLRAVAGYGCIAGSVILNRKAISTYDKIPGVENPDFKEKLYQESLTQDLSSEILAYTAVAIWVSDLVWTLLGTSDLNKMTGHGLSFMSVIDPVTSVPLVGLKIRF